jgi:hypothetical protein
MPGRTAQLTSHRRDASSAARSRTRSVPSGRTPRETDRRASESQVHQAISGEAERIGWWKSTTRTKGKPNGLRLQTQRNPTDPPKRNAWHVSRETLGDMDRPQNGQNPSSAAESGRGQDHPGATGLHHLLPGPHGQAEEDRCQVSRQRLGDPVRDGVGKRGGRSATVENRHQTGTLRSRSPAAH